VDGLHDNELSPGDDEIKKNSVFSVSSVAKSNSMAIKNVTIDLVMPGYLESSVNETGLTYDDIKKKLLEYKESNFSEPRVVKRMTDEIRVLVWYECLSTLMVFYHRIRDILLQAADECLKGELSLPLLKQRIVIKFLEAFFSSELDEKVENFFKSPGD
jgi:hypothetical protein